MGVNLKQARLRVAALAVFRGVFADPVVAAFRALLESEDMPLPIRINCCGAFAASLLAAGGNWSEHLLNRVLRDENPCVHNLAEGRHSPVLEQMAEAELLFLEELGRLTAKDVATELDSPVPLPEWSVTDLDYRARYREYAKRIPELGYGVYAEHHMFMLEGGKLIPVRNPDAVKLNDLTGYERERNALAANTLALAEGRPAANALLYGDSGTGKSTCVKAAVNQFKERGVRLIELRKDQLLQVPELVGQLSQNPLRFILFIDDLSFTQNSDSYAALKGILEGSAAARGANTVIYATSNRRHFIRESFSGREGDDVHLRDTLEELTSLSDRFGLTLTFQRPERELYLEIAKAWLKRYNVPMDENAICEKAEAFALARGGRSARTARQFAEAVAVANG